MKKNISFIPVDSVLETQLLEKLMREPLESDCAEDLLSDIRDVLNEEMSSLLLSSPNETEAPASVLLDGMRLGKLEIYPKDRKVIMQRAEASLTSKGFEILYFLAQSQSEVLTKEQIYRAVRAEDYLLDNSNIMTFTRKLRKKTEPDPDVSKYILVVWGIGYKFNDRL